MTSLGWGIDSMKRLQGWTDSSVSNFHDLAVTGERIVASIRWGDWTDIENIEEQAKLWARQWSPEIKKYIYGLRTVTGVDLSNEITDSRDAALRYLQPSLLLRRRLGGQRAAMLGRPPKPLPLARLGAWDPLNCPGPVKPDCCTTEKTTSPGRLES